jgi:hypothetical protein
MSNETRNRTEHGERDTIPSNKTVQTIMMAAEYWAVVALEQYTSILLHFSNKGII